jgi:taurine dioxygenase
VPARSLVVRPLCPALGAEIVGVDLAQPVPDDVFDAMIEAWHTHLVILLRDQRLTEQQQWHFGLRFGPLAPTRFKELEAGHEGVVYVSNVRKDGKPIGVLPDGEMQFHSDQAYRERPSLGSMLYAIDVPATGGNTLFANCCEAYDALPEEVKRRIDGMKAQNVYDYNVSPTRRSRRVGEDAPSWIHPVVRTHPVTGRKALYVNRLMTVRIVGVSDDESDELLAMLFDHAEQRRFVYEHVWRVGDVLLWDNRCTMHARTAFDPNEVRTLRRITLAGEPVA